ncbi:hypothetical protein [Nocardia terrae]|uniref:hypothetical protein n=1 Tax=Nocardia terrae TaxID=2675851 RepID=UPI0018DFD8C7|nr:hypothetical protein [Nocardia terrae]
MVDAYAVFVLLTRTAWYRTSGSKPMLTSRLRAAPISRIHQIDHLGEQSLSQSARFVVGGTIDGQQCAHVGDHIGDNRIGDSVVVVDSDIGGRRPARRWCRHRVKGYAPPLRGLLHAGKHPTGQRFSMQTRQFLGGDAWNLADNVASGRRQRGSRDTGGPLQIGEQAHQALAGGETRQQRAPRGHTASLGCVVTDGRVHQLRHGSEGDVVGDREQR